MHFDDDILALLKDYAESASQAKAIREKINNLLFSRYCGKGYLTTCEPEFCVLRYTNNCKYLQALSYLAEEFGISIKSM